MLIIECWVLFWQAFNSFTLILLRLVFQLCWCGSRIVHVLGSSTPVPWIGHSGVSAKCPECSVTQLPWDWPEAQWPHHCVNSRISISSSSLSSCSLPSQAGSCLHMYSFVFGQNLKGTWMWISGATSLFIYFFFNALFHQFRSPQKLQLCCLQPMRPWLS